MRWERNKYGVLKCNKNLILGVFLGVFFHLFSCQIYAQVGVNTTNPQQALQIAHIDTSPQLGRMTVESLNNTNNGFNGGDLNNDTDLTNDFYPLYVDQNGDFTLKFIPFYNSGDLDALNDTELPTNTVNLLSTDVTGNQFTTIISYPITVERPAILEVKYSISFDVYLNPAKNKIVDNLSRRVITYMNISGSSRGFGPATNNYSSGSINSVAGTLYNSSTAYIVLPHAGTYILTLFGGVASDVKANSTGGDPSQATYVEFATGHDFLFFRLY